MASTLSIVLDAQNKASAALNQVSQDIKGVDEAATGAKPGLDATAHSIGPGLKAAALIGGAALVGLGAAVLKLGADFDSAYDSIIIGTGAAGEALEGLKDDFRAVVSTVPTDFGKASQAIADLNTRTGLSGPPLQELTKTMLEFSRLTKTDVTSNVALATRVFGDWSIATGDQAETLDKLFRASQLTGASVSDLMAKVVQYGAPLRAMNFSFEESVAMLGKWEKEGVNTELVLGSMRIAMGNFARDNVPMRKGLEDTFKELQRLGPGAKATSLAMEVFGARAGPDMAAAILEGRFALGDLVASLEGSEGAIAATAEQTMDFSEKLTMFKNRALLAIEPVASGFFDLVNTVVDQVGPAFANLSSMLQPVSSIFGAIRDAGFGSIEMWEALGGVQEMVMNALRSALDALKTEFPKWVAQLGEWARAMIDWIAPQIPVLAGELLKFMSKLMDFVIAEAPGLTKTIISEWVPAVILWVAQAAIDILPHLVNLLGVIITWLVTEAVPKSLQYAWKMGEAIVTGVVEGMGKLGQALWDAITAALESIHIDWGWIVIDGRTGVTFNISGPDWGGILGTPKLPEEGYPPMGFQRGGLVPGLLGAPRLAVVHGGEMVLTPQQQGGITFTGNIILPGVSDWASFEREAARHGMRAAAIRRSPGR